MDRKIIIATASAIIILTLVLAYVIVNMSGPSTTLYLSPQTSEGAVGQDVSIEVNITNAVDLYAWQIKLSWNNTMLEALSVTEGPFLRSSGNTFFAPYLNNTSGYVFIDCTLLGGNSGAGGDGMLATINLHVKEKGHCDLRLYYTMLFDSFEKAIPHRAISGSLSVNS